MADTSKGFEQSVIDGIVQDMDTFGDALGQSLGMPPGAQRYSDREIDAMMNYSPIADPEQRAQKMVELYHQGVPIDDITDQVYPNRRKVIETGRPRAEDQIAFAQQWQRRQARTARDLGHHIPGVEPWASITQENAPPQETSLGVPGASPPPGTPAVSSAPAGNLAGPAGAPILDATPMQATSAPGWGQPGGQFSLTGPQA